MSAYRNPLARPPTTSETQMLLFARNAGQCMRSDTPLNLAQQVTQSQRSTQNKEPGTSPLRSARFVHSCLEVLLDSELDEGAVLHLVEVDRRSREVPVGLEGDRTGDADEADRVKALDDVLTSDVHRPALLGREDLQL